MYKYDFHVCSMKFMGGGNSRVPHPLYETLVQDVHTHTQEYLSKAAVVESSVLELSHSSRRRSMSSLSQCSYRKLVTGLSYHVMYGESPL